MQIGSEVVVKGLVSCVLDPAYYGYFLYDSQDKSLSYT